VNRIVSRLIGAASIVFFWRIIVITIEKNKDSLSRGGGQVIVTNIKFLKVALDRAETRASSLFVLTIQVFFAVFIMQEMGLFIIEKLITSFPNYFVEMSSIYLLLGVKFVKIPS